MRANLQRLQATIKAARAASLFEAKAAALEATDQAAALMADMIEAHEQSHRYLREFARLLEEAAANLKNQAEAIDALKEEVATLKAGGEYAAI
jgi:DNA-binding transcriptional regulator PaaX